MLTIKVGIANILRGSNEHGFSFVGIYCELISNTPIVHSTKSYAQLVLEHTLELSHPHTGKVYTLVAWRQAAPGIQNDRSLVSCM